MMASLFTRAWRQTKQILLESWLTAGVASFVIFVLCYHLWFLWSFETLAGWDLTSIEYLAGKMTEYIREGRFTGYDPSWYAGYPAFSLYPPLLYVILALPHILTFEALSITGALSLFLFFAPFVFMALLVWSAWRWFGRAAIVPALILGLLFLLAPRELASNAIGLHGLITVGFVASFLGLLGVVFIAGYLAKPSKSWRGDVAAGVVFGLTLLSHPINALFVAWILCWRIALDWRVWWKRAGLALAVGLVLASPWLIEFSHHRWLHSAQEVGLQAEEIDPLRRLFPELAPRFWGGMFSVGHSYLARLPEPLGGQVVRLPRIVFDFPFLGAILFPTVLLGLAALLREHKWYLPVLFVVSLLVLPRGFLTEWLDAPLLYYRFVQPLFVVEILLAVLGMLLVRKWLESWRRSRVRRSVGACVALFLCWALVATSFKKFDLEGLNHGELMRGYLPTALNVRETSGFSEVEQALMEIGRLKPTGRVAVETVWRGGEWFGTPHYLNVNLPVQYGIEVAAGFLMESSPSAAFINPALHKESEHIRWGDHALTDEEGFIDQSLESMVERLGLFNVQYILALSERYRNALRQLVGDKLTLALSVGRVSLFELEQFKPFLQLTSYQPYLFVDKGGVDFRSFAKFWYLRPDLFDYPVLYTPKPFKELSFSDRQKLKGVVLSYPESSRITSAKLNEWLTKVGHVIVLNATVEGARPSTEKYFVVPTFSDSYGGEHLAGLLARGDGASMQALNANKRNAESLSFATEEGGVLVNLSWAPRWTSSRPDHTVFMVTPSLMWVFTDGETELTYR